jgi:general L-amino acid transport system substrate-binding protein
LSSGNGLPVERCLLSRAGLAALGAAVLLTGCEEEPPPPPPAPPAPDMALVEAAAEAGGRTLRRVRARGVLNCGVNEGLVGFADPDARGVWRGFDADFCRAVAAAVLGDPERVRFVPVSSAERFAAVKAGRIDLLARNTTVTFQRDAELGLDYGGVSYYDGQGFMVRRSLVLTSATELGSARVCVQAASTTQMNLADYFRARGLEYEAVVLPNDEAVRAAYGREECDAYTADISTLASARALLSDPNAHVILADVISKEPLGPAVRQGDARWTDIVRWTLNVMVLAEELGVTSRNVDTLRQTSTDPEVRRLLGLEGGFGRMLGLNDDWAYQIVKRVGNYGEVFERNVGQDSPLELERGLNALWNAQAPGLMYAPPMR